MESENNVSRGRTDCKPRNKKSPKKHLSFPMCQIRARSGRLFEFGLSRRPESARFRIEKHENDLHFARARDIVDA